MLFLNTVCTVLKTPVAPLAPKDVWFIFLDVDECGKAAFKGSFIATDVVHVRLILRDRFPFWISF